MSIKKRPGGTRAPGLSIVAPVSGSLEGETRRLLETARACRQAQWILVDSGTEGLAHALSQSAALKSLKAKTLDGLNGASDWGCFLAASPLLTGKACLLLPGGLSLSAALFRQLTTALSSAEIVFSRRPSSLGWPFTLQKFAWQLPALDFGSPSIILRDRLLALSKEKGPRSYFLGPRLAREALRSGSAVKLCEAADLEAPKGGISILGEGTRLLRLFSSGVQALLGLLLFLLALAWIMPKSNFLGLCLMGLGFFLVGTVFGEDEA